MSAIPVPYVGTGALSQIVLGHYGVGQRSGVIAASMAALSVVGSFRWAPTASYLAVLMKVRAGIGVHATLTQSEAWDISGTVARSWTVDYSSNNTQANMAITGKTGTKRSTAMSASQLGTKGPQIATTVGMTGATSTIDADFMHVAPFHVPGTTVGLGDQRTLFEWTGLGQHPLVFYTNEGYILRNITAAITSGTYYYYIDWDWAECISF